MDQSMDKGPSSTSDFLEAAGLLEYDPAAITRIYAGHPQRLRRRLWQTLVPIGLYLLGVGFDWLSQRLKNPDHARARAREAADLVASLGPAFIKARPSPPGRTSCRPCCWRSWPSCRTSCPASIRPWRWPASRTTWVNQ
jgi:hypothetical protein